VDDGLGDEGVVRQELLRPVPALENCHGAVGHRIVEGPDGQQAAVLGELFYVGVMAGVDLAQARRILVA
jgi:hypothetical protein